MYCRSGTSRRVALATVYTMTVAAMALLAAPAMAQDKQPPTEVAPFHHGLHAAPAAGPTAYDEAVPPLFDNLGRHTWPITTRTPQAQAFFDQGLRLAYGFNHAEARRAFRAGAAPRPVVRHVLLGRGLGARPEHQRSDGARGQCARVGRARHGRRRSQPMRARRSRR